MAYDKTTFLSGLTMGLCGKGDPTFTGSGKMLYNGVELPALPKTDLQYAVLTHHEAYHYEGYGQVIDEPERYQLSILAEPFYAETNNINGTTYVRSNPLVKYQRWLSYAPDFSKWELGSEGNRWTVSYEDVVWTNHNVFFGELADTVEENIIYTDELYMAKSPTPVPVEDTFSKGYLTGAALRSKRKLPVAYLYNGVRLPSIYSVYTPELQVSHPYAYITGSETTGSYYLYYSESIKTVLSDGGLPATVAARYTLRDDKWVQQAPARRYPVIWSNTDVYYGNSTEEVGGTLYLAASDPIPVYE